MPELERGAFLPPPPSQYKIGSQNTPYKLGLNFSQLLRGSFGPHPRNTVRKI